MALSTSKVPSSCKTLKLRTVSSCKMLPVFNIFQYVFVSQYGPLVNGGGTHWRTLLEYQVPTYCRKKTIHFAIIKRKAPQLHLWP